MCEIDWQGEKLLGSQDHCNMEVICIDMKVNIGPLVITPKLCYLLTLSLLHMYVAPNGRIIVKHELESVRLKLAVTSFNPTLAFARRNRKTTVCLILVKYWIIGAGLFNFLIGSYITPPSPSALCHHCCWHSYY
jgi:hypothetical protein